MKHLTEFYLESGGFVLIEVDEPVIQGRAVQVARPGDIAQRASETLEAAIEKIKPATESVIHQLRNLNLKPDEITIEFGIKMSVEAGAFIASTSGEANFQISMKWAKEKEA